MANVSVKEFAEQVGTPVDRLLTQLEESGVKADGPDHVISDDEKMKLLAHLREGNTAAAPKKISVKRRSTSEIKTVGTAGRSRTVNVEVRKRRTFVKREDVEEKEKERMSTIEAEVAERRANEDEVSRREREALQAAEATRKEAEEQRTEAARQADEARKAEEERKRLDAEQAAAAEAARKAKEELAKQREASPGAAAAKPPAGGKDAGKRKKGRDAKPAGRSQIHVAAGKSGRRRKKAPRQRNVHVQVDNEHGFEKPTEPVSREVEIGEMTTVAEMAQQMAVKAGEVIRVLMDMGAMVTINQPIDQDTAQLVVEEMGHSIKFKAADDAESKLLEAQIEPANTDNLLPRPPVVTVMGHVDHGKTSLLDFIRTSKVTAGEAGGITQHIGAYHVQTGKGGVTFLDTPGHAAFTSMRARGAQATDVVILVVAADDSVMPQTIEAINHARAADVQIVVAVNKCDKPDADPEKVRNEMSAHKVIPEEWGGDVQFVNVSAQTGDGVDALLESVALQAELLELTADPDASASGIVVEAALEKGRGAVATVLVRNGTLRQGDMLLCGQEFGRVRAMFNDAGQPVSEAGPAMPVVVLGLSGVPKAGDEALAVPDEKKAREVAEFRQTREREQKLQRQQAAKLENLFERMGAADMSVVNVVLKADVQGSAEALRESLTGLSNDEVKVNVITSGVGGINESDVTLAEASGAFLIGFNVRADAQARKLLDENELDVHYYSVIYEAIDTLKLAISGLMKPEVREEIVGLAEVRDVFRSSQLGAIAGCLVIEGAVRRDLPIRVLRDNVVIYEGELESLRRFKDDVKEVQSGTECGIGVKNYNDVKAGDQIECYTRTEFAREL